MKQIKLQFKKSPENGQGEIVIDVSLGQVTGAFSTGVFINANEWDEVEEKVIFDSNNIMRAIFLYNSWEKLTAEIEDLKKVVAKLDRRNPNYTFDDLEIKFRGATGKRQFLSFMEEQIALLIREKRVKTAQSYTSARKIFSAFLEEKDIALEYIDSDLICDFEQYLITRGMVRNTTSFYVRILRSAYNKAVQLNLVKQCFPFSQVYTGIDKTQKRAASQRAIYDLENDRRLSRNMSLARDLFLFSFYCRGISFVDLARLKQSNIKNGVLSYVRSKTGQQLHIGLEPCMEKIIRRYEDWGQAEGYLFPIVYNENDFYKEYASGLRIHNLRLHRISKRLKIDPPLTSYVARHTWATLAKKKGVPLGVISECMGHTSEGTTKIYLASLDQNVLDKANKMIITGRK